MYLNLWEDLMWFKSAKPLVLCNLHFGGLWSKCKDWIGKSGEGIQGLSEHCGDVFYVSKYAYVCAIFGKSCLKTPAGSFGVTWEEDFRNKVVWLKSLSFVFKTPTSLIDVPGSIAGGVGLNVWYPAFYCCSQNILTGEGVIIFWFFCVFLFV